MKHFFVIYDSVFNSVFLSQVVAVACKIQNCVLVTFEQDVPLACAYLNKQNLPFEWIVIKRLFFISQHVLFFDSYALRKILRCEKTTYKIIARGPIAGYIAVRAATQACVSITVQARGLLAAEYEYTTKSSKSFFANVLKKVRYCTYAALERAVYDRLVKADKRTCVEAVSAALRTYLTKTYFVAPARITVASADYMERVDHALCMKWRQQKRDELGIAHDSLVYCYSGSAHPWQLPDATIELFEQIARVTPTARFLILTTSPATFNEKIELSTILKNKTVVRCVVHADVPKYLAAADFGVVLREKHLLNWISRPTKFIEFCAVGVPVIHNGTIAQLATSQKNFCVYPSIKWSGGKLFLLRS